MRYPIYRAPNEVIKLFGGKKRTFYECPHCRGHCLLPRRELLMRVCTVCDGDMWELAGSGRQSTFYKKDELVRNERARPRRKST